jgi:predicted kinase
MKKLALLCGVPASGKSTLINENNLGIYTLSTDDLRLMLSAPQPDEHGNLVIPTSTTKKTFDLLYDILEYRMKTGSFTIIDATNTNRNYMDKFIELSKKYDYEIVIVPMGTPIKECIERNKTRGFRKVPDIVIYRMNKQIKELFSEPIDFARVMEKDDFINALPEYIK